MGVERNFYCRDTYTNLDLYTKRGLSFSPCFELNAGNYETSHAVWPNMYIETTFNVVLPVGGVLAIDMKPEVDEAITKMKCILTVGQYYFNGTVWVRMQEDDPQYAVDNDLTFEITFNKGDIVQYHKINIYSPGAPGYQADINRNLNGKLRFCIVSYEIDPYDSQIINITKPIRSFAIKYASRNSEVYLDSNKYEKDINTSNENNYEVNTKISTHDDVNKASYNAIFNASGSNYLGKVIATKSGRNERLEEHLLDRLYRMKSIPRESITINVRRDLSKEYTPLRIYQFNGKSYALLNKADNWVNQTVKLTIIKIDL